MFSDLKCDCCGMYLAYPYIKCNEDRYCSDCYDEEWFIQYSVGGEYVGTDYNVEEYNGKDKEVF